MNIFNMLGYPPEATIDFYSLVGATALAYAGLVIPSPLNTQTEMPVNEVSDQDDGGQPARSK